MKHYCPYCSGHHPFNDAAYIRHLAKHSPDYARVMGLAMRLGHQESQKSINQALRGLR